MITPFLKWHSDLAAQKFVHKISCSPTSVVDPNASLIMTMVGTDRKKGISRCTVKYRIITPEAEQMPTIGHIDIDVSQTLKQVWGKRYRSRKFEKMDLVMKEGITNMRELEWAELILRTYESVKDMAVRGHVTREDIASHMNIERMELKQMHSIIATDEFVGRAYSMSKYKKLEYRYLAMIEKETRKRGKIDKKYIAALNQSLQKVRNALKKQIEMQKRLIAIQKKYEEI